MSLSAEDARKIGGSDLAAILGLSPWGTPLSVYARVVAGAQSEDGGPKRRGRHLEAAVLNLYAEETGLTVVRAPGMAPLARPYMRASLDAIAFQEAREIPSARRVVEVKTASVSELRQWGEPGTDQVPQHYLYQVAWYAGHAAAQGMVDTTDVDVAALVGGDLRVYVVPFDAELFGLLQQAVERFWVDYVEPRRPPPVTEPLRDVEVAGALYPRHAGRARHWESLSMPEQVAVREWLRARAARIAAKKEEAEWEARAKLALGATPQVIGLPPDTGARSVTWRQGKPRSVVDWQGVARRLAAHVTPDMHNAAVALETSTKEGARPLRVSALREHE